MSKSPNQQKNHNQNTNKHDIKQTKTFLCSKNRSPATALMHSPNALAAKPCTQRMQNGTLIRRNPKQTKTYRPKMFEMIKGNENQTKHNPSVNLQMDARTHQMHRPNRSNAFTKCTHSPSLHLTNAKRNLNEAKTCRGIYTLTKCTN